MALCHTHVVSFIHSTLVLDKTVRVPRVVLRHAWVVYITSVCIVVVSYPYLKKNSLLFSREVLQGEGKKALLPDWPPTSYTGTADDNITFEKNIVITSVKKCKPPHTTCL